MRRMIILAMMAALATVSQADPITSFVNLDFDSGGVTTPGPFRGFDAPDAPEIEGWTNYRNGAAGPLNDAGVEAADVGWWLGGYTNENAGFMSSGDAAYTMSTYTIRPGDVFTISYIGARWGWTGEGQWTASLFYDDPANVFGTYVQDITSDWLGDDVWYTDAVGIVATPASVGHTLGILMTSTGTAISQIDEITVDGPGYGPSSPVVTPDNGDGTVGSVVSLTQADVTLNWKAAGDPNAVRGYPVDPDILRHNVYLSNGGVDDPNVYLIDSVVQVHNIDPFLTDPNNSYGPLTLSRGLTYYWQIEEVLDNGAGGYPDGDPNNVKGPLWSFEVVPANANITVVTPAYSAVDAGNDVILSCAGSAIDTYQWYKIGDPDVALANGADYTGVDTDTLTILGVQVADEGTYYCVGTNSLPSSASNKETGPARVLTKRLMSHYPMETMDTAVDANGITPDIVNGFDMRMASNDTGGDVPVLDANSVAGLGGTYSLLFDNPRANPADPNNGDAQYAQVDEGMAAAYEDITISAWVYSKGGSNWNRILDFGNNTNNYVFLCLNPGSVNNAVRFAVKVNGTEQTVTSAAGVLPLNEWTFVSATLTGSTARLYIDGELVATNTNLTNNPLSFAPTTQNWLARSQWGGGDGYFNGMVDDLKIYNYGLTGYDVAQEYLAVEGNWVCDMENYDMADYDVNDNCVIDMPDFAALAVRWLEDDNFYLAP